jgi:tetratricopeptide (TPR) repeat protein
MQEMLNNAENYYQIAVDLEFSSILALKYANYLFHQRSFVETILIVQQLLNTDSATGDIIFSGIEQVVAPELIQLEIEEEEIIIPASVFSKYLLVVCYRHLRQLDNAEYYIVDLMDTVYASDSPLLASILGYCIMELGIFDEARFCFERAIRLSKEDCTVALRMGCFCLCLELYKFLDMLYFAQFNIYEYYYGKLPYYIAYPVFRQRRLTSSGSEGYGGYYNSDYQSE